MDNIDIVEEVEAMIEAGELAPSASSPALRYMAGRWVAEQSRKRKRAEARRGETQAQRRDRSAEVLEAARRVSASYSAALEVNWPELFDDTFALPDGSRVTWGDATLADHEARASSLEIMAAGDLETAAMHRAAAERIKAAGATTLRGAAS